MMRIKKIVKYIWQLPQNILGVIVLHFSKAENAWSGLNIPGFDDCYYETKMCFGVSLGNYVIVQRHSPMNTIRHEYGHQRQSLYLGWLYLFLIGIPSITCNIYDRVCHKDWEYKERVKWYYSLPWEAWADKLGGVKR